MFEERVIALNESEATYAENEDNKRTYTVEEVQDILGVSKTSAYNLVKSNAFHCVKVGGHYRVSKRVSTNGLMEVMNLNKKSMSVAEMRGILGLGKTESYWLIKKNYFDVIVVFDKMRVMVDSFEEWYANQFHYKKVDGTQPGQNWSHTFSIHEVAVLLGISDGTVYDIVRTKSLPTITVSGKKRIEKDSFEKWYASQGHYKKAEEGRDSDV